MSNINKKKETQSRAQDYVTNKLLSVFTIAFVLIIALMSVSRMMRQIDTYMIAFRGVGILAWALLALTALFAGVAIYGKVNGRTNEKYRLLTAGNIACVLGFATICFGLLALAFNDSMLRILYVLVPSVTVLYIIFHTYPSDFFALSAVCGFGAIGLWLMGSGMSGSIGSNKVWLVIGLLLAFIAVATVLTIVIQANGGALCRSGKFRVFKNEARYALLYVTYALIAVLTALTWIFAGAMMYYFVLGLLAYLVAVGIYYTIKMM